MKISHDFRTERLISFQSDKVQNVFEHAHFQMIYLPIYLSLYPESNVLSNGHRIFSLLAQ